MELARLHIDGWPMTAGPGRTPCRGLGLFLGGGFRVWGLGEFWGFGFVFHR